MGGISGALMFHQAAIFRVRMRVTRPLSSLKNQDTQSGQKGTPLKVTAARNGTGAAGAFGPWLLHGLGLASRGHKNGFSQRNASFPLGFPASAKTQEPLFMLNPPSLRMVSWLGRQAI